MPSVVHSQRPGLHSIYQQLKLNKTKMFLYIIGTEFRPEGIEAQKLLTFVLFLLQQDSL